MDGTQLPAVKKDGQLFIASRKKEKNKSEIEESCTIIKANGTITTTEEATVYVELMR